MKTLHRATDLPIDAAAAWELAQRVDTFRYITKPLVFPGGGRLPERLEEGGRINLKMPGYRHTIEIVEVDDARRTIRTNEHGGAIRAWRHTIRVEPTGDGTCRYSDTVEIDAGPLTPVVHSIAQGLYAHRQRRWHKLVAGQR